MVRYKSGGALLVHIGGQVLRKCQFSLVLVKLLETQGVRGRSGLILFRIDAAAAAFKVVVLLKLL